MSSSFDDIIRESRAHKFAIILDGVEMNLVMLALEMVMDDERMIVSKGPLADVLAHFKNVSGGRRFLDLMDLKNIPEITEEAVREMIEQRFLDGTCGDVNTQDGSR